jgi:hypothetical protein
MDLMTDEEIVLESEGALLTNKRIITNWHQRRKNDSKIPKEVKLEDIASYQKISGGQEGRLHIGVPALVVGLVLTLAQILLPGFIPAYSLAENVVFLIGTLSLILGVYFSLSSLTRVRPHTTVLFQVPGGDDLPVYFPGKDNADAEKFGRQFARTKRGI